MAAGTADLVRAFIAIALEPGLTVELEKIQRQFQSQLSHDAVRWARPEQVHLTLRFLGNVSRAQLADLTSSLIRAPAGITPFQLALEGAGCFPNMKNPRVVWIGINGELDSLRRLQIHIERVTSGFGDQTEKRPFQAHLTIGRPRVPGTDWTAALAAAATATIGRFAVAHLVLVQSQLSPKGSIYTPLVEAPLAA